MFYLKISKNAKENLFLAASTLSVFLTGMVAACFIELMFPRFSGSASVVGATFLFLCITALATVVAARAVENTSVVVRAGVFAVIVVAACFFLPFHLSSSREGLPPLLSTQNILYSSAFFAVLATMFPAGAGILRTHSKDVSFFVLPIAFMAGILGYVVSGMTFIAFFRKEMLLALFILETVCFAAALYADFADKQEQNDVIETQKTTKSACFLSFYVCLICMGLAVSLSFRGATHLLALPKIYLMPFFILMAAAALSFSKAGTAARKGAFFLQPFTVALFLLLFFFQKIDAWFYPACVFYAVIALCALSFLADIIKKTSTFPVVLCCFLGATVGVLASLTAPMLFGSHVDIPVFFVLAVTLRPGVFFKGRSAYDVWRDFAVPLALFFLCFCFYFLALNALSIFSPVLQALVFMAVGAVCLLRGYPIRYALMCAVLMVFGVYVYAPLNSTSLFSETTVSVGSFYGENLVSFNMEKDGRTFSLYQEGRLTGFQAMANDQLYAPQDRYMREGAVGAYIDFLRQTVKQPEFAVIGIGSAPLATYALTPHESWTFFEPDEKIAEVSTGRQAMFRYFLNSTPFASVVVGEPLFGLIKSKKRYDVIFVDTEAFATFPLYLMTEEALRVMMSFLTPDGVLMFNVPPPKPDITEHFDNVLRRLPAGIAVFEKKSVKTGYWFIVAPNPQVVRNLVEKQGLWRNATESQEKNAEPYVPAEAEGEAGAE